MVDILLVVTIITLALYEGLNGYQKPQAFIIVFTFFRTEEFALMFCTLLFLSQRQSKESEQPVQ